MHGPHVLVEICTATCGNVAGRGAKREEGTRQRARRGIVRLAPRERSRRRREHRPRRGRRVREPGSFGGSPVRAERYVGR